MKLRGMSYDDIIIATGLSMFRITDVGARFVRVVAGMVPTKDSRRRRH
jgi:hypothetical protein